MTRELLTEPLRTLCEAAEREKGPCGVIVLPWPPGVNNLFATVKTGGKQRRIPTRRYKAWLAEAASALSEQQWSPAKGSVRVRLFLSPPDNRVRDADGFIKAPVDFLVKAGVLAGDSREHVRGVSADWSDEPPAKPGSVRVTLEAAP